MIILDYSFFGSLQDNVNAFITHYHNAVRSNRNYRECAEIALDVQAAQQRLSRAAQIWRDKFNTYGFDSLIIFHYDEFYDEYVIDFMEKNPEDLNLLALRRNSFVAGVSNDTFKRYSKRVNDGNTSFDFKNYYNGLRG